MNDRKRCIRCAKEVNVLFEAVEAIDFERYLLREGHEVDEDDVLCNECVKNVVDFNEL